MQSSPEEMLADAAKGTLAPWAETPDDPGDSIFRKEYVERDSVLHRSSS
jgi:hypothetical protein